MQLLFIVIATRGLLTWLNEVAANAVAVRVKSNLREQLFAHILALGPAFSRGERTGELTTAAVEGIEALDAYFSQYLPQLVISTLVPVLILILVFPLDLLSGIILLLTAPLIPFFMYMIGRSAEGVTKKQYETLSRTLRAFSRQPAGIDHVEAVRSIQSADAEHRQSQRPVPRHNLKGFASHISFRICVGIACHDQHGDDRG